MCHYPKGLIWLLLLKAGHVWSQHLRWSESCSKDLRHLYFSWWISSASCFLFWILKTLLLSLFLKVHLLFLSFCLWFNKLVLSCLQVVTGPELESVQLFFSDEVSPQFFPCWFTHWFFRHLYVGFLVSVPPRHQKCCIHHQQSPPRSSHQRCSVKKSVLKNFAKFTGKHLRQSLFFNKVADAACNFIKKETLTQVFCCEFYQISFCLVKSD